MKKNIRKAIVMALVLVMAMTTVAQADTIISPVFRLPSAASRPTEVPTVEPTAEPTAEPTVEPTAEPTAGPTEEPVVEVTAEPTEEPTEVPVVEATAEPTVEPTAEPTEVQVEKPVTDLAVSISSNLAGRRVVVEGTEMILTAVVTGADEYEYTIQWQQSSDNGATWQDIPGAQGTSHSFILRPEHNGMYWRAVVDVIIPDTIE